MTDCVCFETIDNEGGEMCVCRELCAYGAV